MSEVEREAKMKAIHANIKCIETAQRKVRWVQSRTDLLLDLGLILRKLEEAEKSLVAQYHRFEQM